MLRYSYFIVVLLIIGLLSAQTTFARTANDFFINEQIHLEQVEAEAAWDVTTGSSAVVIAIIDTGIDLEHPDLKDNIWVNSDEIAGDGIDNDGNGYIDDIHGWDFVSETADPGPKLLTGYDVGALVHGTIVAGAAGAVGNNEIGVAGVAWDVSLMSLRALDHTGTGDSGNVVKAVNYAVDNGADIINLSVVGTDNDSRLADAIKRAYENDVAVVAAAGNEGDDHQVSDLADDPHFPVCHDGPSGENYVVGVAGVDQFDQRASYSNFGDTCIDIAAPGSFIVTTQYFQPAIPGLRRRYTDQWSGTSLAAPIVSGALALLKSARPDISIHSLVEALLATASNIDAENPQYVGQLGSGRIALKAALAAVQGTVNIPVTLEPIGRFIPAEVKESVASITIDKNLQPTDIVFCVSDTLIKSPSSSAVYYCGADGKRYVFPNQGVYASWYGNFSAVLTVSDEELAAMQLGGNVTYRPGTTLVKITTDPKVYAVDRGGVLRWIPSEMLAEELYGSTWRDTVQDVEDIYFSNYAIGTTITAA